MAFKTFGDIVAEVERHGFADGPQVNKSRIENWVNEGQRQIASLIEAPEFQETEVLTMSAGKKEYTLPSGFERMQSIYYPEMTQRLRPVDLQTFDMTGSLTEGPPDRYTIYKNELWLYPTPNVADKLELRFIKRPAVMSAEGTVPTLAEPYLHLLVQYALIRAYEAEDDAEMAAQHKNRYEADLVRYGVAQQDRSVDRPRQLDGPWGGSW